MAAAGGVGAAAAAGGAGAAEAGAASGGGGGGAAAAAAASGAGGGGGGVGGASVSMVVGRRSAEKRRFGFPRERTRRGGRSRKEGARSFTERGTDPSGAAQTGAHAHRERGTGDGAGLWRGGSRVRGGTGGAGGGLIGRVSGRRRRAASGCAHHAAEVCTPPSVSPRLRPNPASRPVFHPARACKMPATRPGAGQSGGSPKTRRARPPKRAERRQRRGECGPAFFSISLLSSLKGHVPGVCARLTPSACVCPTTEETLGSRVQARQPGMARGQAGKRGRGREERGGSSLRSSLGASDATCRGREG